MGGGISKVETPFTRRKIRMVRACVCVYGCVRACVRACVFECRTVVFI